MKVLQLLWVTASVSVLAQTTFAQDQICGVIDGEEVCEEAVGFAIAIDDKVLIADDTVVAELDLYEPITQTYNGTVDVRFDGLNITPRLDAYVIYSEDQRATIQTYANYPAFIERAEIRVYDRAGGKTLSVHPVTINEKVLFALPEGENLVFALRVYDRQGRFDETEVSPFELRPDVALGAEQGIDRTARRRIPVNGGAITVSGDGFEPNSFVRTMGEPVKTDTNGAFVLQRILPPGEYEVGVEGKRLSEVQKYVEIPKSDWFYTAIVDVTIARSGGDLAYGVDATTTSGRIAGFAQGRTYKGVRITAAVDTGEVPIEDLLRGIDKRSPESLLDRLDPANQYPTYGDDSEAVAVAPTSGKLYLEVAKDNNYFLWGDFRSDLTETEFVRSDRAHYGASGAWQSAEQTSFGEARVAVTGFAALPETQNHRDVLQGTGGSSYFLKYQDITVGSETLYIERRDPVSGRILDRIALEFGRDYTINYMQGHVLLRQPLASFAAADDLFAGGPKDMLYLVASYEHHPTAGATDAYSYGARTHVWATDQLGFGVSYLDEKLDDKRQVNRGVDLTYRHSETSYLTAELAESEGPGHGYSLSQDGGLTLDDTEAEGTSGQAWRVEGQLDLADFGDRAGVIGGYAEHISAGFSSLSVSSTTDQRSFGVFANLKPSDAIDLRLSHDEWHSGTDARKVSRAQVQYAHSEMLTFGVGLENRHTEKDGETNTATDLALRMDVSPSEEQNFYGFYQGTLVHSGSGAKENRFGLGASLQLSNHWSLGGEVSSGTNGLGGRVEATYSNSGDAAYHVGYVLDRTRQIAVPDGGKDYGQIVFGTSRTINDRLQYTVENRVDLLGSGQSLAATYGLDYDLGDYHSVSLQYDFADLETKQGPISRNALSATYSYDNQDDSKGSLRLEYRRDRGDTHDAETFLLASQFRHDFDEQHRVVGSLAGAYSRDNVGGIGDSEYADVVLGYAFRPIKNDRFNMLAQLRYLHDVTPQLENDVADGQPNLKAGIVSVDASLDLTQHLTFGAKFGARFADQDSGDGWFSNNATLAVVDLRYHFSHEWSAKVDYRRLDAEDIGTQTAWGLSVYRHFGDNFMAGIGYQSGIFSDDLADTVHDEDTLYFNVVAKF